MNEKTKLAFLRKAKGMSQTELAQLSGVNIHMIRKYEQGARDINKAEALTVYKLSEALGVTVPELLEI